jgi:DNA-binding transcriptional ArsR family regulator
MTRLDRDVCDVPCYKAELVARLQGQAPADATVAGVAQLFALLADPTRVRVLAALGSGGEELCVCDVANVVGLTISATSHQLRKLREAGIVTVRNDGRMAFYKLSSGFAAGLLAQARIHIEAQQDRRPDASKAAQS